MKTYIGFDYHHWGLGIRYSNWSSKHHALFIDVLCLSITLNWKS